MASELQIRAPRKAKMVLDRLLNSRQLTQGGMDWLVTATDPFHDSETTPTGFPDTNTCHSIPQCFTYTQSIAKDPGIVSSNWDAHIFFAPYSYNLSSIPYLASDSPLQAMFYSPSTGQVVDLANRPDMYAGYNCIQTVQGGNWSDSTSLSYNVTGDIGMPLLGGMFRLVAAGLEVVNTTPDLYKGGSATVFRSPSLVNSSPKSIYYLTFPRTPTQVFALPPFSQSSAQLYPSSRTWSAAEGAYCIGTLNNIDVPYQIAMNSQVLGIQPPPLDALKDPSAQMAAWTYKQHLTGTGDNALGQVLPFDTHGVIFGGLSPQTTLQVTVKYYVERIPTVSEPDLLVLSRKPPTYDPLALEIYTRALSELPVGVMVKDNPLGEWFNDVLSTVAEMAPLIGSTMGPMGVAAGKALARGSNHWLAQRGVTPPSPAQQAGPKKKKNRKRKKRAPAKAPVKPKQ